MAQRISLSWIHELVAPYLRGYRARATQSTGLRGYWFHAPGARGQAGFFVGYREAPGEKSFPLLPGEPPHCLVFAFVKPKTPLHRRLVAPHDSLLCKTNEYIRWLTHRPPRFVFSEDALPTLLRGQSMAAWPHEKWQHLSRNFFIETLAWLVRSGLVRKLAAAKPRSRA